MCFAVLCAPVLDRSRTEAPSAPESRKRSWSHKESLQVLSGDCWLCIVPISFYEFHHRRTEADDHYNDMTSAMTRIKIAHSIDNGFVYYRINGRLLLSRTQIVPVPFIY